jgi:hypothetical protein
MKASEFIIESTELALDDGTQIAVRSYLGRGNGTGVTMLVTKDVWNAVKNQFANTETMQYDLATAETIVNDWVRTGSKVIWKTAADLNREARELENHRFRNDPSVSRHFDSGIAKARDQAKATSRAEFKTIK